MSEREEFEKWYGERYSHHAAKQKYPDGSYSVFATQLAWNTWRVCAALKDKRIAELEAEFNEEAERHAQLQARCYDQGGSQSVFDRVKELEQLLATASAANDILRRELGFAEAELAEQAKVLVDNVDKQLALEAANKDLQAWFDNVKADYDALKASPTIRELSDEEIASTFEAAVKASPEYAEDDGDIPDDVRALIITCSRAILAKARGEL